MTAWFRRREPPTWLMVIFAIVVMFFWGILLFPFLLPVMLLEMFNPERTHQPAGMGLLLLAGGLAWGTAALVYFL